LADLLEDLVHDLYVRGFGCGPNPAREEVVLLHKRGEQQRVAPALDE
jgi:hypothetical protein